MTAEQNIWLGLLEKWADADDAAKPTAPTEVKCSFCDGEGVRATFDGGCEKCAACDGWG